jgi:hypothetical protein
MTREPPVSVGESSERLTERVERALGLNRVRPELATAAAAGVAAHLFARLPADSGLSDRRISLALAVGLCALGETEAALRLLVGEGAMCRDRAERFCRAVTEAGSGSLRRDLLCAGWLSPRIDPSAPSCPAWSLDVGALVEGLRLGTELEGVRFLDRIACDLAPLWSESGGRGRLFLKGLPQAAAAWSGRSAQRRRLRTDVPARVAQRLMRLAALHAWRRTPEVVREELDA